MSQIPITDFDKFKYDLLYELYAEVVNKALQHNNPEKYQEYFNCYSAIAINKLALIVREKLQEVFLP